MNWEAIGAIGEMAGAVAVVLTLIYLSVQVRQNSLLQEKTSQIADAAGNFTPSSRLRRRCVSPAVDDPGCNSRLELDLTPFHGHLMLEEQGVRHAKIETALSG